MPEQSYEEIDLWSLVGTLIRGKWLIAFVTAVAMALATVFSFLVLPPVYEARSMLIVSSLPAASVPQVPDLQRLGEVLAALDQPASVSPEAIETVIKSPALLARVAEQLGLDESGETLAKRVAVTRPRSGNALEVVVKGPDPAEAARLANALAEGYSYALQQLSVERLQRARATLETEMANESAALEGAQARLTAFLQQGRSIEGLRGELSKKLDLLADYQSRLVSVDVEYVAAAAQLGSLRRDLAGQPPTIRTERALIDDPLLSAAAAGVAALTVSSEELNPVYVELAREVSLLHAGLERLGAERSSTLAATAVLGRDTEALRLELTEREAQYDLLRHRVDLHKQVLQTLTSRHQEARLAEAITTSPVSIVPAVVPQVPVGPRKLLNVTIAGVLGLLAGVMLAFFLAGWEQARPRVAGMMGARSS